MIEAIQAALVEERKAFADTRVHYCQVEASLAADGRSVLEGAVLDQSTLDALVAGILRRVPGAELDATAVQVLRAPAAPFATVVTNLTGLYAQPSFLAEQISQMLGGWRVEVLLADGRWRFARQADGYLGWVYALYLAEAAPPAATHIVIAPEAPVWERPAEDAPLLTRVLGGTAVAVDVAERGWHHLSLPDASRDGWVREDALRALTALPQDEAGRRELLAADARRFVGVPYLWGGCSAYGIDCSGFVQLLHRLAGIVLPRDADMQLDAGAPLSAPPAHGDLLFFGELGARRSITHVAMSLGGWRIIHSSRSRNGVYFDDVQAVDHLRESFVGAASYVKDA